MVRPLGIIALLAALALSGRDAVADPPRQIAIRLADGTCDGVTLDDRGELVLVRDEHGYRPAGSFVSKPIDCRDRGPLTVDWIARWTAPQRFEKHPSNPIFGPAETGPWDDWTNGVAVVRDPGDASYKMFYSGRAGAGIGFAEATLADPLHWRENPASPVLVPRADNWEGNFINQPRVVRVTDTHWRMYYTGWGFPQVEGGSSWAIGLAESFDAGRTWRRHGDQPLLARGDADSPDGGGVFVPEVRRVNEKWMMWYTAMRIAPGRQNIHLCLATSDDGIRWTKHPGNPVLTDDFSQGPARNVISRCFVRHADGVYQMWYSHARPDYRIRYAESLDGIHWERSPVELALDVGPPGAWDDQMVEYPELDLVGDEWRLWFCGNDFGTVGYARGIVEGSLQLEARSGPTATPGGQWSDWKPILRGSELSDDFVQFRATLRTQNRKLSPRLHGLWLSAKRP